MHPDEAFMPLTTTLSRRFLPLVYYSGIWSLVTLLRLCVGPVYAEWVDVGGKVEKGLNVYTVYVDTESIHRNGDIVTLWALFDYMTIQSIVGGPWLSSKTRRQYDCVQERVQLLGYMTFTGNMGSGEAVYSNSEQSTWEPMAPDGIDRELWEIACSRL
jgi:Surface-adhesin protein E